MFWLPRSAPTACDLLPSVESSVNSSIYWLLKTAKSVPEKLIGPNILLEDSPILDQVSGFKLFSQEVTE